MLRSKLKNLVNFTGATRKDVPDLIMGDDLRQRVVGQNIRGCQ